MGEPGRRRCAPAILLGGLVTLALALAGCSAPPPAQSQSPAEQSPAQDPAVVLVTVIDVRTPGEYAAGHLEGAINIDIQAADFAAKIAALSKNETYIVYCRSGNRSATAAAQMTQLGLDVTDAGGLQEASRTTGLPIVT